MGDSDTSHDDMPDDDDDMPDDDDSDLCPPPIFQEGCILLEKYELIKEICRSTASTLWLVRQMALNDFRALKLVAGHAWRWPAEQQRYRHRLRRMARLLARLRHRNIVTIYDYGTNDYFPYDDQFTYCDMEYVNGITVKDTLAHQHGPMPLEWIVPVVDQLCSVLQAAHHFRDDDGITKPIIYRCLDPANLVLVENRPPGENLKVLGFTYAKVSGFDSRDAELNEGRFVWGPIPYCSPEQIISHNGDFDYRTDLYSVGILLYELLTGLRPFRGDSIDVAWQHVHCPVPAMAELNPNANVSPFMEAIVHRCLAKNPVDRYQTAAELASDLRWALNLFGDAHDLEVRLLAKSLRSELKLFYLVGRLHYQEGASSLTDISERLEARDQANKPLDGLRTSVPTIRRHCEKLIEFFRLILDDKTFRLFHNPGDGLPIQFTDDCKFAWVWTEHYLRQDKDVGVNWWGFSKDSVSLPKKQ